MTLQEYLNQIPPSLSEKITESARHLFMVLDLVREYQPELTSDDDFEHLLTLVKEIDQTSTLLSKISGTWLSSPSPVIDDGLPLNEPRIIPFHEFYKK